MVRNHDHCKRRLEAHSRRTYFELIVTLPEKSITPVYCNGRTVTGGTYKFKSREAAMEAIRIMHVDDYLAMEGIK